MEPVLLDAILDNTQIPHQPFVVIGDTPTFSGLPLLREVIRRGTVNPSTSGLLVSFLHLDEVWSTASSSKSTSSAGMRVLDFRGCVPGYTEEEEVVDKILAEYASLPAGSQVYIEAIDIFAEDYGTGTALKLVRSLLKAVKAAKAPARLTLLLPLSHPLHAHLLSPTLSPTITHLIPHPPALLTHLSESYLQPINADPRFWLVLENANKRRTGVEFGFSDSGEVGSDWGLGGTSKIAGSRSGGSGNGNGNAKIDRGGAGIQVLVRKAAGGTKGISRSLEALLPTPKAIPTQPVALKVVPLSTIIQVNPLSNPSTANQPISKVAETHQDLNLPFNLSLTDEQRRKRMGVALPYQHEGDGFGGGGGGGGVGMALGEWDEEDDELDDEEV